jgi:PKD repeat protein/photosystem II stability/assembly factor-like uncharacterized protein
MRLKLTAFLILVLPLSIRLSGQSVTTNDTAQYPYWVDMMQQPRANFAAVQRAFNLYWENRKITKGSGWKPFKRWEYYWQDRLDSNGNLPAADDVWKAYFRIKDENTGNPLEQKFESDLQYKGNEGNWKPLGPGLLPQNNVTVQPNGLGRIAAIAPHPTDSNIIYAGSPAGGFWISKDNGQTWRTTTDSLPTLGVSAIAVNPSNPNIIYIGTGDRDNSDSYAYGVLKSTDGGETWFSSNNGMGNQTVGKIIIDPTTPSNLLAATSLGVYISTNAGNTWTKKSITGNFKDIVYKPGDYNTVYATEGGNFYLSTNGGSTFSKITSGLSGGQRGVIGVSANAPDYVYFLLTSGNVYKGMYLSTNSGTSFSARSTTPNIMGYEADGSGTTGQAWYDLCIAVDPNDINTVYAGGVNIFKSTDGGVNWLINAHWTGNSSVPVHADQHIMAYSPVTKNLYVGNDGGIYYTNTKGTTWTDISSGIAVAQVYRMGQATQQRKLIINGYQDNGTAYYNNGLWSTIRGGDGMDCIVDYSDPSVLISSLYYGDFDRYKNGKSEGTFAAKGKRGITESGGWVTPIVQHNTNPSAYFVGYNNIWRTTNAKDDIKSVSWTKISDNLGGSNSAEIRVIEQCANKPDVLYLARSDYKFFRSDDINATNPTYTDLTTKLPLFQAMSCIETTPANANKVYVGIGKKIFRSDNKGASWTDITANLPVLKINTIVIDTSSNLEEIYVGTDAGIYYKNQTLTNWVYFNAGLPLSVNVNELEIYYNPQNPSNAKLRAATYGRGMWESDLYKNGTEKPVAHFTSTKTEACIKSVLSFEDNTGNIPTQLKWQFSPNTVTYVNNTTDTSQDISVRFNASGNYTISLIASNANGTDTFVQTGAVYVYDTARHICVTSKNNANSFGIGVFNVKVANIDNPSEGADQNGSYEDYTCNQIIKMKPDSTYAIEIITGGSNDEFVKVFIDYNSDGDFKDVGEFVYNGPQARTTHTGSFKTPQNPTLNKLLRMRVISDFAPIGSPDCPTLDYGQSEDYNVYFDVPSAYYTLSSDTLCTGDTLLFSTSSYGKIASLQWDFGAGAIPQTATGEGPFKVYYTTDGYKKITKTINGGSPIATDSVILVGATPNVSFFAHDTLQCVVNRTINFVNNTTVATGNLSYLWSFGDNKTATSTHYFKQYSTAGIYTVVLKATGNFGCTDSAASSVKVSNSGINSSFSVDSTNKCLIGNRFKFINTTTPPPGVVVSYKWYLGDNDTANSTDTVWHSYATTGTYNVKFVVASTQGCKDSVIHVVTVYSHPKASFVAQPHAQCQYGTVKFSNNSFITTGSLSYRWDLGNGDTSIVTSPSETYNAGGSYTVKLKATSDRGCSHDTTGDILIFTLPQARFTKRYLSQGRVVFSPDINGYPGYSWNFGDSSAKQTTEVPTHQYTKKGTYTVTLQVFSPNGCLNTYSDTVAIYNTGVANIIATHSPITVQPNPFENNIEITFEYNGKTPVTVFITDVLGRKVMDVDNAAQLQNEFKGYAQTQQLAKGIYFVVVETNNTRQSVKIVK